MNLLEKKKARVILIVLLVYLGLMIAVKFPEIQGSYIKYMVHQSRKESIVMKNLTDVEMAGLMYEQATRAEKYGKNEWGWWRTDWLKREIYDGSDLVDEDWSFMSQHPEYDSAKVAFIVTKYKVDGKTVEFMSNGKITQLHSKSGWKDKE